MCSIIWMIVSYTTYQIASSTVFVGLFVSYSIVKSFLPILLLCVGIAVLLSRIDMIITAEIAMVAFQLIYLISLRHSTLISMTREMFFLLSYVAMLFFTQKWKAVVVEKNKKVIITLLPYLIAMLIQYSRLLPYSSIGFEGFFSMAYGICYSVGVYYYYSSNYVEDNNE